MISLQILQVKTADPQIATQVTCATGFFSPFSSYKHAWKHAQCIRGPFVVGPHN